MNCHHRIDHKRVTGKSKIEVYSNPNYTVSMCELPL